MALNKFFKQMRESYGNTSNNAVANILTTNLNGLFPTTVETDKFMSFDNSNSKEAFIIDCVCKVLNENSTPYLVAKNANNDVLIEHENGSVVLSIQNHNGNGKFSLYSTGLSNDEKKQKLLSMYIAYRISNTDNGACFNKITLEDDDSIESLSAFVEAVRNDLYDLSTGSFYDTNNQIRELNMTLGLPFTTGMQATNSLVLDSSNSLTLNVPNSNDFQSILCSSGSVEEVTEKMFDEIKDFNVTPDREFDVDEEILILENEERTKSYVVDPVTMGILTDFVDLHKVKMASQSMAFYGPSGAGKTTAAQIFARERHIPYVHYKMRENSDEDSLRGTIKSIQGKDSGNIEYEDSAIIKALKYGWCCEVQELSTCTNQGAETFFNPIFDKTKSFEDASGNVFPVHPDAMIIFTYNPDYCENNQIATSLLNRIEEHYRYEFPDMDTCVQIFKNETGFGDETILKKIYNVCFGDGVSVGSIKKIIEENDLEEELSLRQVINWINRYNNCRRYNGKDNGWLNAAIPTVINSLAIRETEVQSDIISLIESVF